MIRLMGHQARVVRLCAEYPRFAFWLDCGTGKTIAMLAMLHASKVGNAAKERVASLGEMNTSVLHEIYSAGDQGHPAVPQLKTVVVCPKAIMRNAWERDARHFPNLNVVVCWDTLPHRRRALITTPDADLLVINFEMFKKYRRELWDVGVRRLIVDESSKLKNRESQITKLTIEFADCMESVYLLSGTPAPNNGTEYWAQMRVVDKGVFGEQFYQFAGHYFIPLKRQVWHNGHAKQVVTGYRPLSGRSKEFVDRPRTRSWSLRKEQAMDLPEQLDVIRTFEFDGEERRAYEEIAELLRAEVAGGHIDVRVEARINKLRQLCGGWLYDESHTAQRFGHTKLATLVELLAEIENKHVVIWADFREDIDAIVEMLGSMGQDVGRLDGALRGDTSRIVDDFQAGRLTRLVCHPASVGHGVTLTAASYMVFFTLPWSYELYEQARNRIHRTGQTNRCTYFHLIAEDTVDEAVLWAVKEKQTRSAAMMKALGAGKTEAA